MPPLCFWCLADSVKIGGEDCGRRNCGNIGLIQAAAAEAHSFRAHVGSTWMAFVTWGPKAKVGMGEEER